MSKKIIVLVVLVGTFAGFNVGLAQTGATIYFDVQPRTVDIRTPRVTIYFKVNIERDAFLDTCASSGGNFEWQVYVKNEGELTSPARNTIVREGRQDLDRSVATKEYKFDFTDTLPLSDAPRRELYGRIKCAVGSEVERSSLVPILQTTLPSPQPPPPSRPGEDQNISWSVFNPLPFFDLGSVRRQPTNVVDLIFGITNWLFNIASSLIVILIIYSGVRFMISRGNPGEIQKAKGILYWALIGFAVVVIGKGFIYLLEGVISGIF